MIVVYAIGALVLGIVGGTLTLLAQGLCYLVPWDAVHWINLKVLARAEEQSNWRAADLVRKAATLGAPYIAYKRQARGTLVQEVQSVLTGSEFVKVEVAVQQLSSEYEVAVSHYQALRLVCLELTDKSQDEIDLLVSQRLLDWPGKS